MSLAPGLAAHDPFAPFCLDRLISGAARLRPQSSAFGDSSWGATYGGAAAQAASLAQLLREHGLEPGERIIILGGAEAAVVIAMVGALRAGLEPALAPLDLTVEELAAYATEVQACACIGTTHYGTLATTELMFATAACTPSIRLIGTLGPDPFDGAVDLSSQALARLGQPQDETPVKSTTPPKLLTLERKAGKLVPLAHNQSTLIAAGLDLVPRARIARETPILSTLPPVTFAGLVAGPVAALLAGTSLHLHGPFDSAGFLSMLDRLGRVYLVAPQAIGQDLVQAGITKGLASLILASRLADTAPFAPPPPLDCSCRVVDLYAFGESAAVAEERRSGTPSTLAAQPHYIAFDDTRILVVEAKQDMTGRLELNGRAVTARSA
jgi:acyl-CoA synthetase (AMP-forming)/AMP-acid ligase II